MLPHIPCIDHIRHPMARHDKVLRITVANLLPSFVAWNRAGPRTRFYHSHACPLLTGEPDAHE